MNKTHDEIRQLFKEAAGQENETKLDYMLWKVQETESSISLCYGVNKMPAHGKQWIAHLIHRKGVLKGFARRNEIFMDSQYYSGVDGIFSLRSIANVLTDLYNTITGQDAITGGGG